MAIRFFCPKCNKPLEADNTDAGTDIICFYCEEKIAVPNESDQALAKPDDSSPSISSESVKSKSLGVTSFVLTVLFILVFGGVILWAANQTIMPVMKDPEYAKLTQEDQQAKIKELVIQAREMKEVQVGFVVASVLAILGFITSIIAIIKKNGLPYAVVALLLSGIYLGSRLMILLKSTN